MTAGDARRTEHRDRWWPSPTVDLGQVVHIDLPRPFEAVRGGRLPTLQVSYESWGKLTPGRDNAILVIHPLASDCHASGEFADQPLGWWEPLIGPGRALDTDRYFVLCANVLGGCYGTTGPRFPAEDGEPWLERFPLLTPRDMMRAGVLFLDALQIPRARMVIGPSMGGMVAWEWAIGASDRVEQVVAVAAPLRTTPHQIGLNWLQRRGIELDITQNEVVAEFGQMIARGVGMLSYRTPVGLEEKFGREWFKEPGKTLGERGMFNVESWLRHHGKRITKRFDPFTYILYSRAMDLHDVSEGRGGMVEALDRVRTRVLVVGISSDALYPASDVHMGADILNHLGREVRYEEIRSPHGHDAFLLETDQLGAMLRDAGRPAGVFVPSAVERERKTVRIGILGAGRVAASFVRLLAERRDALKLRHGLDLQVTALAEIDRDKTLDSTFQGMEIFYDPVKLVTRPDLDVVLDLTRGPGARDLVEQALSLRRHVVTPNKTLLRAAGRDLERTAFEHGVRLAYHDAIAGGWPLVHALDRPLSRGETRDLAAMVSSAANVILEAIERGQDLPAAVETARRRGLTEPDPALDISGWDTAEKLCLLLTRLTGTRHLGQNVETRGIEDLDPELVRLAPGAGLRIKLVGFADGIYNTTLAMVGPVAVPAESHLGLVRGTDNVVVSHTRDGEEMVHLGSGGGSLPVATAVLNDVVGLFDPSHSWTGRFPTLDRRLDPPVFAEWLVRDRGELTRRERPEPGAVPILAATPLSNF